MTKAKIDALVEEAYQSGYAKGRKDALDSISEIQRLKGRISEEMPNYNPIKPYDPSPYRLTDVWCGSGGSTVISGVTSRKISP